MSDENKPNPVLYPGLIAAIAVLEDHRNIYIGHANILYCADIVDALQAVIDEIKLENGLT